MAAGMCLCAPCAGASTHATGSVIGDAFIKTMDPFGIRHHIPIITSTEDAATALVKKPLVEVADTMKWAFIAGSCAVIAFVAYEIVKKPAPAPRMA